MTEQKPVYFPKQQLLAGVLIDTQFILFAVGTEPLYIT